MVNPIDTFTDSYPSSVPPEVERFINSKDRKLSRILQTFFRLGWHYGYIDCLEREPAKIIVKPDLNPMNEDELSEVFRICMAWANKRSRDPAELLRKFRSLGLDLVHPENLDETINLKSLTK